VTLLNLFDACSPVSSVDRGIIDYSCGFGIVASRNTEVSSDYFSLGQFCQHMSEFGAEVVLRTSEKKELCLST